MQDVHIDPKSNFRPKGLTPAQDTTAPESETGESETGELPILSGWVDTEGNTHRQRQVEIYSDSMQRWVPGTVKSVDADQFAMVIYWRERQDGTKLKMKKRVDTMDPSAIRQVPKTPRKGHATFFTNIHAGAFDVGGDPPTTSASPPGRRSDRRQISPAATRL
jgi:hypothetical protein